MVQLCRAELLYALRLSITFHSTWTFANLAALLFLSTLSTDKCESESRILTMGTKTAIRFFGEILMRIPFQSAETHTTYHRLSSRQWFRKAAAKHERSSFDVVWLLYWNPSWSFFTALKPPARCSTSLMFVCNQERRSMTGRNLNWLSSIRMTGPGAAHRSSLLSSRQSYECECGFTTYILKEYLKVFVIRMIAAEALVWDASELSERSVREEKMTKQQRVEPLSLRI